MLSFKFRPLRVGDLRLLESLKMILAVDEAQRFLLVSNSMKTIHHHYQTLQIFVYLFILY